ncbi:branched-chain amino acid ABC transporter permease [Bosea sp. (in: a-proteobacteria)]|jgi:branched-chain amino acid transport system permease protein|uniref:branched-chain amino acid ABC transporter permease n=1 Tax=Bosea sp. (in: a-proteobacteria) TaxID=1871050 RepID=UPI00086B41D6|nr:branched-chain amino acid ABC transporter permease [Bosea sp. (in: a-proteobacteria)]MBN9437407.1 branched-chain amino acid ABC transporter permease [Bosea sp. (in: a-proteobacteria)]MBN9449594.1 branched-chain amino acid ABC transporter permease [Bosea sp. (in: a-proteobacteria)]ODT43988.1 MAG: ABC transporter permease [Methylobacterium sp. SCN 67-24]
MLTILFDGIAYGMVLFVLGCGLSVTMGLMNFVNLAHGAFAMLGGYVAVLAMQRLGLPFLASLPLAFLSAALVGIVLERLIYRPMYAKSHLDQVMFSIGLVFMAVAGTDWLMGSTQQFIRLPAWLQGRFEIAGIGIGRYRLFVIAICGLLAVSLQWGFTRTRFGSRLRAAVDDARVARGLGIPVNRLFALTFALGCGLAGLGGALGVELMGLDPTFPLKFMIYFLIVVTVGGTSSITGPFFAAMLLGVADVVGKYLVPQVGAFIIYALMVGLLITRPHGLFARARA